MLRFVLRRKFRDAISGAEVDNQVFTIDADVPKLEGELRRGGYSEYGYEIIELVGAEVLNPKCEQCNGEGTVDSGGVEPWGAAINLPCPECNATGRMQ